MTEKSSDVLLWNGEGLLSPIAKGEPGHSEYRSPYRIDMTTLCRRFAISPERIRILDGLLRFRAALHKAGIDTGFQWIDGSFVENIELLEERPPNDVDIVTFYQLPDTETQATLYSQYPHLFDQEALKASYFVDGYYLTLGQPFAAWHARKISYWYSMWSHRRNDQWKGFLQLNLAPTYDKNAQRILNQAREQHNAL